MGRVYTATFTSIAQTTSGDVLQIVNAADSTARLLSASYTQTSEAGDTQAEQGLMLVQRATSAGTGGTAVSANAIAIGDAADGATILRHNTVDATTLTVLIAEGFNWQIGWFFTPTNHQEIEWGGSDILVFNLGTVPADSITTSMTVWFEEIG